MLIAKLTQPVEKVYQGNGLQTTVVTAQYLIAQVDNYVMGQLKTQFYYKVGKVEFDEQNKPITFETVFRGYVDIDVTNLENWGTDDFVALRAVASALNVEIEDEQLVLEGGIFKS
jgi:hypothetical protein